METQGVQETLEHVHAQKHATSDAEPSAKHEVQHDAVGREGHLQAHVQSLLEEHQRQLLVGQREGPDTEVRGRVGDGAEDVLDGLDDLVDEDLPKLELLAVAVAARRGSGALLVLQETVALGQGPLLLPVVLPEQDEWLREEHERHRQHCVHHQLLSQLDGARPERVVVLLAHGHTDQRIDDVRGVVNGVRPLVEDHHVHPPEEAEHEDHHRNALKDEIGQAPVVDSVAPAQEQADNHLKHAEKHGEFHLHRVDVEQLISSPMPSPIYTEGIRTLAA
mmetsp:Transcript_63963/g.180463  ORF Transcript_63963/g.180463 Transcript_63963/m.180463 type:complete len:277 (-) Transcript_63963:408-1238(-)